MSTLRRNESLREVYGDGLSKFWKVKLVASKNRNFDISVKQYAPAIFEELRVQ